MSGLPIPTAEEAEMTVAGCAAATRRGARLAAERVDPGDLWDPACRRVLTAAFDPAVNQGPGLDARLDAVARLAQVDRRWLDQLVEGRVVMWDDTGSFASQVLDAARRRRLMTAAAELHEAAATGAPIDDLLEELACSSRP